MLKNEIIRSALTEFVKRRPDILFFRQPYRKAVHSAAAFHLDTAVVKMHDSFDDSKPHAISLGSTRFIGLIEFVEYFSLLLRTYLRPEIAYPHFNNVLFAGNANADYSAIRREFYCIINKVYPELL